MRKYYSGRLLYIKDPKRYKEVITNGDKFHNQNVKDAEEYVKDYGVFIFTPTKGGYREISTGRTFGYVSITRGIRPGYGGGGFVGINSYGVFARIIKCGDSPLYVEADRYRDEIAEPRAKFTRISSKCLNTILNEYMKRAQKGEGFNAYFDRIISEIEAEKSKRNSQNTASKGAYTYRYVSNGSVNK